MALITEDELVAARSKLLDANFQEQNINEMIRLVLEAVAPEKLMASYELNMVLEQCKTSGKLDFTSFGLQSKRPASELQLPELWAMQRKIEATREQMKNFAAFLLQPTGDVGVEQL